MSKEHNSNLFGDASFLAVPAIHFFGFPGYYTQSPPRLAAYLFEEPSKRAALARPVRVASGWICDCLAKGENTLDVTFCRQENSVEDITIRFHDPETVSVELEKKETAKEDADSVVMSYTT